MKQRKESHQISRRSFIKMAGAGVIAGLGLSHLAGCAQREPLLRIASNIWPGYELLYLARDQHYFSEDQIRLVELPSATVCIQSLAAGTIEGAMLTLDEVLTARAEGLNLKIVSVLDVSMGADVLLATPDIRELSQLKGKRIGVEESAVGAVMLDAALKAANLTPSDIKTVYMTVSQHREAYLNKEVDALISFEPVKSLLIKEGAIQLFDSSQIPGRIIDVLAVLPKVISHNPNAMKKLVAAHFTARDYFLQQPQHASVILSKRLQIEPSDVPAAYEGIELSDIKQNYAYLSGPSPVLESSVKELLAIMQAARLLPGNVGIADLLTESFLPRM